MTGPEIRIFPDEDSLADFALSVWETAAREAADKGTFSVALSGGKTPVPLYRKLASRTGLPWKATRIYFADERFVPPHHLASNLRLARETFLDRIPLPGGNIHAPKTEGMIEEAARGYEAVLRENLAAPGWSGPVFDLILLGLGEDGHTASLFPGSPLLDEKIRWVRAETRPASPPQRITLTLPAINRARLVLFLVSGEKKAPVLKRVIEDRDPALPASLVHPVPGRLIFGADRPAASRLGK
jgi:6-phosphogluconolactonase